MNLKQRGAVIALLCFLFSIQSNAQVIKNLVTNGSFEDTIKCPYSAGQVEFAKGWFKPTQGGSSDYFNTCANSYTTTISTASIVTVPNNRFGFQYPRTGNAYQGLGLYCNRNPLDYREYIKNKLAIPLLANKNYCVTFYVSLAEISRFSVSNIAYYFSNDSIINPSFSFPTIILITPNYEHNVIVNDTINWIKIQSTFASTASNNFFTLGNFRDDNNTNFIQVKPLINIISNDAAYYYIDDVSVIEINSTNAAIKDTLISRCFMDSVMLGTDSTEFATYTWQSTAAGLAALSCTNCPNPIAKPLVTTKYYLTKVQCSATTMDSVTVVVLTPTTQANAGNDANVCPNDILQLGTADSTAFVSYSWQFLGNSSLSCTNCATPLANVQQTTEFIIQRTECNIVTNDTVKVIVDLCDISIPTVFTPNADDINDVWKFKLPTGAKLNELNIYNRWGLLVYTLNSQQLSLNYERTTPNIQWDGYTTAGIACTEGVYFYTLSYTDKKSEAQNLKGYVSLFR